MTAGVEQNLARLDDDIAEEEEERVNEEGEGEVDRSRVLAVAAGVAVEAAMVVAVDYSRAHHRAEGS